MGLVKVETLGSFGESTRHFSAEKHGHADAVAQAIEFLAGELLPYATALDHRLHDEAEKPENGWCRTK